MRTHVSELIYPWEFASLKLLSYFVNAEKLSPVWLMEPGLVCAVHCVFILIADAAL